MIILILYLRLSGAFGCKVTAIYAIMQIFGLISRARI